MIASPLRRLAVSAPRLNPPTSNISKATSSISTSKSGRVGMMPHNKQGGGGGGAPVNSNGAGSNQAAKDQIAHSSNLDNVLAVGSISSHGHEDKISRASEGSI